MRFLLGLLVVGIGACDRLSMESGLGDGPASNVPAAFDRSALLDTLRLLPMSKDQDLLSPEQASKGGLDRFGTSDGEGRPTEEALPSLQSPYGCVMSTPNIEGEVAYQYEAVYAFFPEEIVKSAGQRTRHVRFQMVSRTAYAERERSVAHILRQARCRVPDTEQAPELMRKRLERFPAASEKTIASSDGEPVWSGVPVSEGSFSPTQSPPRKGEWVCVERTKVCDNCTVSRGPDGGIIVSCDCEWVCTDKVYVKGEDGEGDGSEDDQTGDDPDECNYEGESAEELCGGGMPPPDSDGVNDTKVCPDDPLKDMEIRATGCKENGTYSVEGGRFGCTRNDGDGVKECGPGGDDFHGAFDAEAEIGTNLYSAKGGTVLNFGDRGEEGWGKFVIIKTNSTRDGQPVYVVYAHLSSINVQEKGQSLTAGEDKIGETGVSGNAEKDPCDGGPPHVHIETKTVGGSQTYNQADYFDPEKFLGTEFGKNGDAISDNCS